MLLPSDTDPPRWCPHAANGAHLLSCGPRARQGWGYTAVVILLIKALPASFGPHAHDWETFGHGLGYLYEGLRHSGANAAAQGLPMLQRFELQPSLPLIRFGVFFLRKLGCCVRKSGNGREAVSPLRLSLSYDSSRLGGFGWGRDAASQESRTAVEAGQRLLCSTDGYVSGQRRDLECCTGRSDVSCVLVCRSSFESKRTASGNKH